MSVHSSDKTVNESRKTLYALLSIALAAVGFGLGLLLRGAFSGADSMNPGFWVSFAAFLFSFTSVRDHGHNGLAMLAFWASFIGMCAAVFINAL